MGGFSSGYFIRPFETEPLDAPLRRNLLDWRNARCPLLLLSLSNHCQDSTVSADKLVWLSSSIKASRNRKAKESLIPRARDIYEHLGDGVILLQGKVEMTTRDFSVHPSHARRKRGLLNLLGSVSNFLFGTATEDEVQDLRQHYNKLLTSADQNRRVVNPNCKKNQSSSKSSRKAHGSYQQVDFSDNLCLAGTRGISLLSPRRSKSSALEQHAGRATCDK